MAQNPNPKTQNSSRNYDAQIGRWLQPDPLMQHPSPYLAMSNNPVSFTDPTGLEDFDGLDNGDDKPKPAMWESKVGEIRTDGKGNSIIFDGETWRFEREVIANDKNHLMMGSFESTVVNEANLPDNSSGTQVSGVNGKLRRVGDAYNRGHYIENERNWAEGMNAGITEEQKAQILKNEIIESIRKSTPEYYGGSGTLQLIGGLGLIGGLTKVSKASIGIRKVGEASEKTLLSSATFYKLGIRGFAPFKVWTPFGSARTWETILGRWTAPTGGSILLFDHFFSDKKKN